MDENPQASACTKNSRGDVHRDGWLFRMRLSLARSLIVATMCLQEDSPAAVVASPSGNHQGGRTVGRKKGKMIKVRQHVNPLKSCHQRVLSELPQRWPEQYFDIPEQPMHVDIGSARGLFCLDLAATSRDINVLGLEIRKVLADAAAADVKELDLGNAAFLPCNANANFDHVMSRADGGRCGPLRSVSIQFPDPWFKSKHHKRRVVQPELCQSIARHLTPGGWLFVQTDVLDLAESAVRPRVGL